MDAYIDLQRAILNNIPDQAWLKDAGSRYVLVNDAFMAACGRTEAEILGSTPDKVWSVEWGQVYLGTDKAVVASGMRRRYEECRDGQDGRLRWFDTIKMPIRGQDGEVVGTVGISRDITDRKRSEQALARLNRLYALRSQTNQAIAQVGQARELLSRVCQIAVKAGGLKLAWAVLRDRSAPVESLCQAGSQSLRARFLQQLESHRCDLAAALPGTPVSRTYVCRDIGRPARFKTEAAIAARLGMASFAALPLTQCREPVGYCLLFAREADFFTPDVVRLLQAISRDLSFALDSIAEAEKGQQTRQELLASRAQLRELSAYLQSVREAERTRISRELHDELGQSLTALRLGLSFIEAQQGPDAGDACRKHLQMLKEIADSTVDAVQRIAADLRPPLLDELGLTAAIEWLAESFSERGGIACELALQPVGEISAEVSTAVFRIAQEALTNASRHGRADRLRVELSNVGGALRLVVADNGRGIDASRTGHRRSLGLLGMRERALMLGGKLAVTSEQGGGTRVEAQIPNAAAGKGGAR